MAPTDAHNLFQPIRNKISIVLCFNIDIFLTVRESEYPTKANHRVFISQATQIAPNFNHAVVQNLFPHPEETPKQLSLVAQTWKK